MSFQWLNRFAAILFFIFPLSGCWFVFIPGSLIQKASDGITGSEGEHCVGRVAKIGDQIKLPDGGIGVVQSLSGTSVRCTNETMPIRASLTVENQSQSGARPPTAAAPPSASPPQPRSQTSIPAPLSRLTRSIAVEWARFSNLLSGYVVIAENGKNGTIRLNLPTGDGECIGSYGTQGVGIGHWVISCPNGVTATGSMETPTAGGATTGSGLDSTGNRIKFTIGGAVR